MWPNITSIKHGQHSHIFGQHGRPKAFLTSQRHHGGHNTFINHYLYDHVILTLHMDLERHMVMQGRLDLVSFISNHSGGIRVKYSKSRQQNSPLQRTHLNNFKSRCDTRILAQIPNNGIKLGRSGIRIMPQTLYDPLGMRGIA